MRRQIPAMVPEMAAGSAAEDNLGSSGLTGGSGFIMLLEETTLTSVILCRVLLAVISVPTGFFDESGMGTPGSEMGGATTVVGCGCCVLDSVIKLGENKEIN